MAFYSHPPHIQLYAAYTPMAIPNQPEFYAVYPPGGHPGMGSPLDASAFYYDSNPKGMMAHSTGKHFTRKDSADSGISGTSSRKTSTTSSISAASISQERIQLIRAFRALRPGRLQPHLQSLLQAFWRNQVRTPSRRKLLSKDWRQVAFAIKKCSKRLEVNDLETKVRRLEELPPYDETTPSRTVVVLNLPMDRPTIEGVAEIFAACGEIVLVRILRPGNPIPADIKLYVAKHPEMTTKVCALVEYERTEFAQKAVQELNNTEEEDKMKVMELTATPLKNGNKKIEARKLAEKAAAMAKAAPQRKFSLQNNFNQPMLQ